MFNHIGHFADGSQAFAKALFFGGVTRRARYAWPCWKAAAALDVYTHLVDRWEKRNRKAVQNNPAHADLALLQDLFSRYGADFIRGRELDQRSCCATTWASRPAAQPRAATGRAGRFRRRRHRVGRGHPQALGGQLLLRLRGRRPHRGGRLQRPRPSAGREDQRDLVLRHRPLGRARPDRAAGRKLGPGRTGRHQRAGLQGPGVRQSLPPLHRGQSRFLPGHGDRAQARPPPPHTKTRAA